MAKKRKPPKREVTVETARAAVLKDLTITVPMAAVLLGISKHQIYDTIREGTFPVPTIKVGNAFRVPTRTLRELLQIQESSPEAA